MSNSSTTSFLCKLTFAGTLVLASTFLSHSPAVAQSTSSCSVSGQTLLAARQNYQNQCSQPRRDCDPVDGLWYCSSETIGASAPSFLSNNASQLSSNTTPIPDSDSGSVSNPEQINTSNTNQAACIDTDGDGWGWTGTDSCFVGQARSAVNVIAARDSQALQENSLVNNYSAADITDLVLVTGQSNALGANTAYNTALDAGNDRVFAFTNHGWQKADLRQIWDLNWFPQTDPNTDPSNNLSLHFGKRMAALDSQRVIGFILVTAPGAAIAHWDYNGEFYTKIRAKVLDAINQLPHKSQLDGILWHQGETDAQDSPYYSNKLNQLIGNLRSENWYRADAPFICGEIASDTGVNNRLNALNNDGDASTACVKGSDLPTSADQAHFTAEALRAIGRRYANQYEQMTRK